MIHSQINPALTNEFNVGNDFEVHFGVKLPPLGMRTYFLMFSGEYNSQNVVKWEIFSPPCKFAPLLFLSVKFLTPQLDPPDLFIENDYIRLTLNSNGLLESLIEKDTQTTRPFRIQYYQYPTSRSGAYMFRSDGQQATPLCNQINRVAILKGPFLQELVIEFCGQSRTIRLSNLNPNQPIQITHNIRVPQSNREVVVRFHFFFPKWIYEKKN